MSILALSSCLILRANPILTFFNIVAILYLGTILIAHKKDETIARIAATPFMLILHLIPLKHSYSFLPNKTHDTKSIKNSIFTTEILLSILITIIMMFIVVPILSSANPIFARMVENSIHSLRLQKLLDYLVSLNPSLYLLRTVFFIFFLFFLPRILTFIDKGEELTIQTPSLSLLNLLIPKIVLSTIIAVFFIAQIQLYSADTSTLQALGYTNSQLTREVFAQLAVVSMIIFSLIYHGSIRSKLQTFMTYLLIAEGVFLTLMAFKSVYDYSHSFGFTFKRLYGFAAVFWIVGVYTGFTYIYTRRVALARFVQALIAWTVFVVIGINIANFDSLIVHHSRARTGEGIDYQYIIYNTSADARAYHLLLDTLYFKRTNDLPEDSSLIQVALHQASSLKNTYSHLDWRRFNFSEYLAYLEIKNIDFEKLNKDVQEYYMKKRSAYFPVGLPQGTVNVHRPEYNLIQITQTPKVIQITLPPPSPMYKQMQLK